MQPPDNRRQLGRYELIARIGEGGMAEVQLARLRGAMGFEKLVVVKLVHEHLASQKSFVEMLMQEARLAALVKHPNVVDIYDLGESEGRYFVAMEYLAGEPMLAVLRAGRDGKRLDPFSTARLIAEVAEGLTAAHQLRSLTGEAMPLVHHDVSLGNIMVLYTGQAKLVDFGVAKAGTAASDADRDRIKGKFGYMAPEKLRGDGGDARSDLFSLGVVLWEALTLRRLFRANNDLEAIQQVLEEPILPPSQVNGEVPKAFDRICARALERDVGKRYQTAAEMARDIESVLREASYSGKYEVIAQYMQATFEEHIRARTQLIKEASTPLGPSEQLVSEAFAPNAANERSISSPAILVTRPPSTPAAEAARARMQRDGGATGGPGGVGSAAADELTTQQPTIDEAAASGSMTQVSAMPAAASSASMAAAASLSASMAAAMEATATEVVRDLSKLAGAPGTTGATEGDAAKAERAADAAAAAAAKAHEEMLRARRDIAARETIKVATLASVGEVAYAESYKPRPATELGEAASGPTVNDTVVSGGPLATALGVAAAGAASDATSSDAKAKSGKRGEQGQSDHHIDQRLGQPSSTTSGDKADAKAGDDKADAGKAADKSGDKADAKTGGDKAGKAADKSGDKAGKAGKAADKSGDKAGKAAGGSDKRRGSGDEKAALDDQWSGPSDLLAPAPATVVDGVLLAAPVLPEGAAVSRVSAWADQEPSVTELSQSPWSTAEHSITEVSAPLLAQAASPAKSIIPTIPKVLPSGRAPAKRPLTEESENTEVSASPMIGDAGAGPSGTKADAKADAKAGARTDARPTAGRTNGARPSSPSSPGSLPRLGALLAKVSPAGGEVAPDADDGTDGVATTVKGSLPLAGVTGSLSVPTLPPPSLATPSASTPAIAVDAARPPSSTDTGTRDVLGGWGWATGAQGALSPEELADPRRIAERRKTAWMVGGGVGVIALVAIVALATGGSQVPTGPGALLRPATQQRGAGASEAHGERSDDAGDSATFPGATRPDQIALAPDMVPSGDGDSKTIAPDDAGTREVTRKGPIVSLAPSETDPPDGKGLGTTPERGGKPDSKIDAKPDSKIDTKPDSKIDAKPDSKIDTKPDPRPDSKPDRTSGSGSRDDKKLDVESTFKAGQAEFLRGDSKSALATFRKVLAASPNYAPAWRGSALALERLGQKPAAAKALRRYLKLAPNASDAAQIKARLERLE